eukprot:TRINITY_DN5804_c0_g2_i3.p1 TRINITY_DN5804_c0_g2~~TRINITY_DN5804_c0_g2_i3.p1  ORF type:complete len:802 (+),score=301.76 TRINITY_DN5804_c0_g2_i3:351-2408(+)
MAMEKRIVTGRRLPVTCSACLYIASRMSSNTPLMLIDFSEVIAESPFAIGQTAEYIMKNLKMQIATVDPTLYIPKYIASIGIKKKQAEVSQSATTLMARMNRDWMSQGRRPAGVLAAAIYLAARLHGYSQIRLESVTKALSTTNNVAMKRLEEAKNLYSKVKKDTIDGNASSGALPTSLLMQQRRDELLKEYLQKRGKDTSIVDGFVESKASKEMISKFVQHKKEKAKLKAAYEKAVEKKKKYRKRRKKEAKVAEVKEARRKEKEEEEEKKEKGKKRKRVVSDSGSESESEDVEVSSVSTSTVPESVHWGDSDAIHSTSSDSTVTYVSTTDAERELPLIEMFKRRRLRDQREEEQLAFEKQIDEYNAAILRGDHLGSFIDQDTANLNDLADLEAEALQGIDGGDDDEGGVLELDNNETVPVKSLDELAVIPYTGDIASNIMKGDELLLNLMQEDCVQELENESKKEAGMPADDDIEDLFDMEGVREIVDETGMPDTQVEEDPSMEEFAVVETPPAAKPRDMKFAPEAIPDAQDFDGLSDVSSEGFDEWIVNDEEEYNMRRKMWWDLHGDWKAKRDSAVAAKEKQAKRKSTDRKRNIMPTTMEDGRDNWDTVDGAVTEAMLYKGRAAVKIDDLGNIFDSLTAIVNSSGRREGMASVLDEAVGNTVAHEDAAWVSDDENNPWDGFGG